MTHPYVEIAARALFKRNWSDKYSWDNFAADPARKHIIDGYLADTQAAITALFDVIAEPAESELEASARVLCPIDPDSDSNFVLHGRWYRQGIPHWKSWIEDARIIRKAMLAKCRTEVLGE